ncbi:MAG: 3'-5' exoribonuclease [Propionivibrio sp.]|uniref:3'-5' exonuclease family protein n=1 Tax=Propionivibrio sp. TaxID=2212460 RepID=UPI0025FA83E8|nr:3'-5' exonuclease family protein [Propionivibrio sp.]MBK8893133.1 3'-5' exoribonuclease [Propionivibrio sp.]
MNPDIAPEPLIFVDLETTGANFANDRIIEIGFVEVDQQGSREWSSLVNPGTPVSEFITGLTGITSAMVSTAPRFEQLAPLVLEKLQGRLFIAHNARFDYTFLKREFKRLGIDFRAPNLCTVKLSRKLFPEHHRHSLDALLARYAITVGDRHRALADAQVLWDLWQRWHELLPAETIKDAIEAIVGRPDLPAQLDPALIDDLPEAPGAYAMYGEHGNVLLIKRSTNIRQQVFAHFAPGKRETALVRDTWRIEWREAAGELGARLRELELSAATRKPLDDLCSWQLIRHGEGDFRPQLVNSRDVDFALANDLFGLYMNRREAIHALRKLSEAHRLCHSQIGLGTGKPGEACIGFKQKTCRGVCVGKEAVSLHSVRLMTALAKFKLSEWPFAGPVALIERDEFGMREDYHLISCWRHLGTVHDEAALHDLLEIRSESRFDPDIYRIINKFLKAGKVRVLPLPRP